MAVAAGPEPLSARRVSARGEALAERPAGAADATVVLPPVPSGAADETAVPPAVPPGAADETAVLPPVVPGAADETAVLPPVRGDGAGRRQGAPADRVPPGFFRDTRADGPSGADEDRTRELPQLDADGTPRRRPRSDWAEETPLDDLPTLADELLGPHADDDRDEGRGRGGRRR